MGCERRFECFLGGLFLSLCVRVCARCGKSIKLFLGFNGWEACMSTFRFLEKKKVVGVCSLIGVGFISVYL